MNNIHWNKKCFLFLVLSFNQTFLNEETPQDPSSEKVQKDDTGSENTTSCDTTPISETTLSNEKKITLIKNLINFFQGMIYNFEKNKMDEAVENKIIEIIQSPKFKIFQKILHAYDVNQKDNTKMQVKKDDLLAIFEFIVELMNIFEKEVLGKNKITDLTEIRNSKNEVELANKIESFLSSHDYFVDKSDAIEIDKIFPLISELTTIQNALIALIGNITKNIDKNAYHKVGFFSEVIFGKGGAYADGANKIKNPFQIYHNEIIIPQLKMFSEKLQKNILLLEDLIKGGIQENTFKNIYQEILFDIANALTAIKVQIENKFKTQSKKDISIKNKKGLEAEIRYLKKSIDNGIKKILNSRKKHLKKEEFNAYEDTQFIKKLYKEVTALNQKEKSLCLYTFQKVYRNVYFGTKKLIERNNLTKSSYNFITNNAVILACCGIALQGFLYIKDYTRGGALQTCLNIYTDVTAFLTGGGKVSELDTVNTYAKIETTAREVMVANGYIAPVLQKENPGDNVELKIKEFVTFMPDQDADTIIEKSKISIGTPNQKVNDVIALQQEARRSRKGYISEVKTLDDGLQPQMTQFIHGLITLEDINAYKNTSFLEYIPYFKDRNDHCHEQFKNKVIANLKETITNKKEIGSQPYQNSIKSKEIADTINDLEKKIDTMERYTTETHKKVFELFINNEDESKRLSAKHYDLKNDYKNIGHTGIADHISRIPFGAGIGAGVIGMLAYETCQFIDKRTGISSFLKYIFSSIHHFGMGDSMLPRDNDPSNLSSQFEDDEADLNFKSSTFDHLRKQGVLEWPEQLLLACQKACSGEPAEVLLQNIPKCVLFTGESGSGKTLIARTLARLVKKEFRQYNKGVPVEFIIIEPKHFNEIIDEQGKANKYDIIGQLESYLEQVRLNGGICILFFDEFHLFLSKNGLPNQEKLADFLKFFNDLNNKQKNMKNPGGMFVIASTNKPEFIPNEFYTNGGRIGHVYEIKYPTASECVEILKIQLKNSNIMLDHINFDYFEKLFQECDLNYSDILKIVKKALNFSVIQNKIVDNDVLYFAFNDVIRRINLNTQYNECDPQFIKNLTRYYASQAAASINFNFTNSINMFDAVTILQIANERIPQHLDKLYAILNKGNIKYGSIFYLKNIMSQTYSKNDITQEIIKTISGLVYSDMQNIPKININNHLAALYTKLYNYFALKIKNIHIAKKIEIGNNIEIYGKDKAIARFNEVYDDPATNMQIQKILLESESIIKEFYTNTEVLAFIDIVAEELQKHKILKRNDIISNDKIQDLLPAIESAFTKMTESIIRIID
jgi:hypothetical protein